jgi:hypothetical protein
VGGEIDSYCTKCKMDLNHRIVAMVGTDVRRVLCLTCGSEHNYRKPAAEKAREQERRATSQALSSSTARATAGSSKASSRASSKAARAGVTREAPSGRLAWERAIAGQPAQAFRSYHVSSSFEVGDLVRHAKFGDGVVARVLDPRKVEILFAEGPRTMAQSPA